MGPMGFPCEWELRSAMGWDVYQSGHKNKNHFHFQNYHRGHLRFTVKAGTHERSIWADSVG